MHTFFFKPFFPSLFNNSPNWNMLYTPHKGGWKSARVCWSRVSHEVYIVAATCSGLWLWLEEQAKIDWTCRCCVCSIAVFVTFFLQCSTELGQKETQTAKRCDFDRWIGLVKKEPKRETKSGQREMQKRVFSTLFIPELIRESMRAIIGGPFLLLPLGVPFEINVCPLTFHYFNNKL